MPDPTSMAQGVLSSILTSWASLILYAVILLCLIYVRIMQVKVRKERERKKAAKKIEYEKLVEVFAQQDKYLAELQEKQDELLDLIQSTQEQLDVLKLNGTIDKELLDLIYHATTSDSVGEVES